MYYILKRLKKAEYLRIDLKTLAEPNLSKLRLESKNNMKFSVIKSGSAIQYRVLPYIRVLCLSSEGLILAVHG